MKAKEEGQSAQRKSAFNFSRLSVSRFQSSPHASYHPSPRRRKKLTTLALAAALVCVLPAAVSRAQKKPKPALKNSDAQRAIAGAPGFALNRGAVKVRSVSDAGRTPVVVVAEVELAVALTRIEAEAGTGEPAGWRADEFRSGDRNWERFEWLAGALETRQLAAARFALQSLALAFETRQRELKKNQDAKGEADARNGADAQGDANAQAEADARRDATGAGEKAEGESKNSAGAKNGGAAKNGVEVKSGDTPEVRRGALRMTELSAISSSARAVVFVEASFELVRGADKKWRVVAVSVGEETVRDPDAVLAAVNVRKKALALADLETMKAALEEFRRERGFYVVAEDHTALIDHLSPRYLPKVIRVDPWHRPYRYEGTRERYTLRSDGADGVAGTPDDVSPGG